MESVLTPGLVATLAACVEDGGFSSSLDRFLVSKMGFEVAIATQVWGFLYVNGRQTEQVPFSPWHRFLPFNV